MSIRALDVKKSEQFDICSVISPNVYSFPLRKITRDNKNYFCCCCWRRLEDDMRKCPFDWNGI